jgi:hypothetical protein
MNHRYAAARCRLEAAKTYVAEPRAALPLLEEARETFVLCGDRWIEALAVVELAVARWRTASVGADPLGLERLWDEVGDQLDYAERVFDDLGDGRDAGLVRRRRAEIRPATTVGAGS